MKFFDGSILKNKVAVISGTTKGLGQSLAEALVEAGAIVVALDRSENDYLSEYCKKFDGDFKRMKINLLTSTRSDIEKIVAGINKEYGRIDILVNNAGITKRGEVDDFAEKDWQDVMKLNLDIPFYLSQAVSKIFIKQRKGKIINVASMLSFQGGIRVPSYVTSKHGVVGLTRSFANALAQHGINVNAIAPGFMETDMTKPLQMDKDRNKQILDRLPARRWGKGEDLKGALIFLASSMSDYIHGIVLPVDGGWLIA